MAIYGIGAYYDDSNDVSEDFINQGVACVGWSITEAPSLHEILKALKVGDIIYIKSAPIGQGLRVKGVGIIIDNTLTAYPGLGKGVRVNWRWTGHQVLNEIPDKNNVRNNTLYEEYSKHIQSQIIALL